MFRKGVFICDKVFWIRWVMIVKCCMIVCDMFSNSILDEIIYIVIVNYLMIFKNFFCK